MLQQYDLIMTYLAFLVQPMRFAFLIVINPNYDDPYTLLETDFFFSKDKKGVWLYLQYDARFLVSQQAKYHKVIIKVYCKHETTFKYEV